MEPERTRWIISYYWMGKKRMATIYATSREHAIRLFEESAPQVLVEKCYKRPLRRQLPPPHQQTPDLFAVHNPTA